MFKTISALIVMALATLPVHAASHAGAMPAKPASAASAAKAQPKAPAVKKDGAKPAAEPKKQ